MKALRKILAALLASVVACTAFAGCTKENAADIEGAKTYTAPDKTATGTLKILTAEYERLTVSVATSKFKIKYPKVDVEVIAYNEDSSDTTELEKLQAKQMMGDGADIVLMDDQAFAKICDYRKVEQAGAYIDLCQYFDRDPDWSWDGYAKAVVDGMKMGDKQYLLPLFFNLTTLVTTDTLLAESGVNLKKCDTGIGLLNELTKCGERLHDERSSDHVTDLNTIYSFDELFGVNPVTFRSGEGKVNFTKEFDQTVEAFDAAGQRLGWFTDGIDVNAILSMPYSTRLLNKRTYFVMANNFDKTFAGLCTIAAKGAKPVVIPIPTADGSGITAQATAAVGISTGCKNPELAYEFIKCMLTQDAQEMHRMLGQNGDYASSVSTQAILTSATERATISGKFVETVTDASGNEVQVSTREYLEQFNALADEVVYTYMPSWYYKRVPEYFWPYFMRDMSLDLCYEDAETQLTIYATE